MATNFLPFKFMHVTADGYTHAGEVGVTVSQAHSFRVTGWGRTGVRNCRRGGQWYG